MSHQRFARTIGAFVAVALLSSLPAVADDVLPESDIIMKAISDELARSMQLQMEDLEKPYFIQYTVDDSIVYQMSAAYGAMITSQRERTRTFYGRTRVGSYELDNTNFSSGGGGFFFGGGGGGGGTQAALPLDDNYLAIRQTIWGATDRNYKSAVETLTKKRSYMKDKNIEDRPHDFTEAPAVKHSEAGAQLVFDKILWQERIKELSGRFKKYQQVQDSKVLLFCGAGNNYLANSEGTRVRTGDTGVLLIITAECQADDGMKFSDNRSYIVDATSDLPPVKEILEDIDGMVEKLGALMKAPVLEEYAGPVLFDGLAAGQMFRKMLAGGVIGKPEQVGTQRRTFTGAENLQKKLKRRILPKSMSIHDDPTVKRFGEEYLFGHYRYDDEGVKARKVDIVVDGKLMNMAMSRVPTKKLSGTNGHGRRPPGGRSVEAAIGCLFIEDKDGASDEQLKEALLEAARDQDMEFGIRVAAIRSAGLTSSRSDLIAMFMRMQSGGGDNLGDPVYAYKVYADDGREELVRGCEFGPMTVSKLKKIISAGDSPTVYNYVGLGFAGATPRSSIIAPSVLFEELDLSKIEQEHEKLPILDAPAAR